LISALDRGEWSASQSGRFTSGERTPSTHWIGGWVGSRSCLDVVKKRNSESLLGLEKRIIQPLAQSYATELYRLSEFGRRHGL